MSYHYQVGLSYLFIFTQALRPEDLNFTKILFIDSGGYETSDVDDFTGSTKYPYQIKKWDVNKLRETM